MRIFAKLFDTYTIRAKILVALAFMAFANVAFADSESLQKLFKEYNVGKDKQEYIKSKSISTKNAIRKSLKIISRI